MEVLVTIFKVCLYINMPVCIQAPLLEYSFKNSACIHTERDMPVYKLPLPDYIWACIGRLHVVPLYMQVIRDYPKVNSHCLLI